MHYCALFKNKIKKYKQISQLYAKNKYICLTIKKPL